ncbi:MAG: ATP-binding protein, partial [Bdellovibrionota bacterium]|nr:ATP-binding protein [Bdellovibrionota bacterium]
NLLNNMRQAVFTVSDEGHIMGPVSQFSEEIFGGEVIGRHIHETIYNGVDKASELYSSINSAMLCVYGSDDLQWDIMKDYLPTRLNYLEENEEDKILKVAYNPLWNEEENLERIMFVVEDITELEKLEKKMAAQKEAAGRNMQMLQELAAGKKEDLGDFFTSAVQMIEMSQKIAKEIRESLEKNEEIKGLDVLFRHLHTIKGNSRVFNLGLISPVVHNVESTVTGFINKEIAIDLESINNFIQDLYLIQGQINEYTKVAKAVFNFDFGEDSRFKVELFNLIKEFELKVSLLIPSHAKLHRGRQKEAEKHYKEWTLENKNLKLVVNDLIKISHSIKGLSRGMDERKLSQATHTFESGLSSLAKGDLDDEKWNELILGPLEQIKSLSRDIYFHSSIFRGFEDNSESWVPLFVDSFKLTSAVQGTTNENKDELINLIDKVRTSGSAKSLDYIPLVMDRMDKILEEENFDKEEVDLCLKELWNFLSFLSSMNVNNNTNDEGRKIIRRALTTSAGLNGIPTEVGLTTFHLFLKDCLVQGFEYTVVLETLSLYLKAEGIETIGFFVPEHDLSDLINKFFNLLNKKFSDQNVKNYISKVKNEDSDFGQTCENAFATRDLFWFRSVKEVALLRLLRTYIESDDDSLEDLKPQMLEVLSTNFEDFKVLLKEDSGTIDIIRTQYERLLDLPVKYSFNKFKTVVKEVAEGLNKKIKFKLSGDQGSLNKDKLYLLQDSMMHLVRNSLDHGIELPDIRVAKGKPELGTVEIECSTKESNKLRIIIRDDGGGIDADKVCAKGVEQGLITKEQAGKMSKSEKLNLIFASTLSTKEEVSEISGRGVGMDVVKKNLEEIGSKIEIQTELGKGTEFIIDIAV